ncbi:MAG: T9SS type A sorting domain-containing protein [Candidatus Cloacimonadales bacterium]
MKKILIISLFLISLVGLFASGSGPGVPHSAVFPLRTADGGYHEVGTFGFMAEEFHPNPDFDPMFEALYGVRNQLYWNWPDHADQNTGNTVYGPPATTANPGRIAIQMATLSNWGGPVHARFWFIDNLGNQIGPINLAKDLSGQSASTTYPDVIAWGGPVAPALPDWAINPTPATGAMGVAIDAQLNWTYSGTVAVAGFDVIFNGAEAVTVASDVFTYNPGDLVYTMEYTWSVIPFVLGAEDAHVPPAGEMPEWTFTTMDDPTPADLVWATDPNPADAAVDQPIEITLEWEYPAIDVTGFEVTFNNEEPVDVVASMVLQLDILEYATEYTWSVKPYREFEIRKAMRASKSSRGTREVVRTYPTPVEDMPVWTFTTMANPNEFPFGDNGLVVTVGGPDGFTPIAPEVLTEIVIPDVPTIPGSLVYFGINLTQTNPGTYTFTFNLGWGAVVVFMDNSPYTLYTYDAGVLVVTYVQGAKAPGDLVVYNPGTLPVELSSFTAVAHASQFVTLKWVTESESNLHGYNVYRAENATFNTAMRINPSVVVANNQAITSTYTYTDNEVEAATYYYWLEVSELSNENTFHGPIVVTVEDEPVIPGVTATEFRNFGPSPFSETTSTSLRVKEGETASITIYNLLGQVVTRETFNAGEHNFVFSGRDSNGKKVANGIYFVRMTSPTTAKNFKIIKMQ